MTPRLTSGGQAPPGSTREDRHQQMQADTYHVSFESRTSDWKFFSVSSTTLDVFQLYSAAATGVVPDAAASTTRKADAAQSAGRPRTAFMTAASLVGDTCATRDRTCGWGGRAQQDEGLAGALGAQEGRRSTPKSAQQKLSALCNGAILLDNVLLLTEPFSVAPDRIKPRPR